MRARPRITKGKREFIFNRDKNRCLICGNTNKEDLTLDHITPWSAGGSNKRENLQTLCRKCNRKKSDLEIDYRKSKRTFRGS